MKPRLTWNYRASEWRIQHNDWWFEVVRKCPTCKLLFIGSRQVWTCKPCKERRRKILRRACIVHAQVKRAVELGKLPDLRETNVRCVDCKERRAVCYDHRDYDQPFKVDPVCRQCNCRRGPAKQHEPFVVRLPKNFVRTLQ